MGMVGREMGIMNGGFGGKSGLVGYCGNRVGLVDCSWVRPLLYPPGVYPVNRNLFAQLYIFPFLFVRPFPAQLSFLKIVSKTSFKESH